MIYPNYDQGENRACAMPPSKLEKYLNILEVLVDQPRKADFVAQKTRMEHAPLRRCLAFLVTNGVVEKRGLDGKMPVYALTERGMAVFKTLRAMKYFEKLRESFPIVDEAREIASVLSKQPREWEEQ